MTYNNTTKEEKQKQKRKEVIIMNNKEVKPYKATERDPRVILPRNEFFNLSYEEKRYLMSYWRENFTTNAILKGMGYNNSTSLYKAIKRLGLPTDLRKHKDLMMKEELQHLTKMPEETKEVIKSAVKDTVETEEKEQEVQEVEQETQEQEVETPVTQQVQEVPFEEEEQEVETEEEVKIPRVVSKKQEVQFTPATNPTDARTIKVELIGNVTLGEIQKVLQFAEEMNLAIKVQG